MSREKDFEPMVGFDVILLRETVLHHVIPCLYAVRSGAQERKSLNNVMQASGIITSRQVYTFDEAVTLNGFRFKVGLFR